MTAQRRLEKTDEPENKRRSIFSSTCMMFCTLQTMGTSSYSTGTHLRNVDTKIAIDSQSVHSLLNRQPRAIHSNNTQRTKLPLTMKLGLTIVALLAGRSAAFTRSAFHSKGNVALYENKEDLEQLGKKLNPLIGYYDPLGIADAAFWGWSEERTIGWLRESEIKHGRVAMAAFVGYCVQSSWVFPWALTIDGTPHPPISLSPPEQWDVLPFASKAQILLFIGFLEWFREFPDENNGNVHYTKGGKPGKYPSFSTIPLPVPFDLFDPFGFSKSMPEEKKEKGLVSELNNGRLAQIGIISLLCEQTIPGSVPVLKGVVESYSGNIMAPFEADFPDAMLSAVEAIRG